MKVARGAEAQVKGSPPHRAAPSQPQAVSTYQVDRLSLEAKNKFNALKKCVYELDQQTASQVCDVLAVDAQNQIKTYPSSKKRMEDFRSLQQTAALFNSGGKPEELLLRHVLEISLPTQSSDVLDSNNTKEKRHADFLARYHTYFTTVVKLITTHNRIEAYNVIPKVQFEQLRAILSHDIKIHDQEIVKEFSAPAFSIHSDLTREYIANVFPDVDTPLNDVESLQKTRQKFMEIAETLRTKDLPLLEKYYYMREALIHSYKISYNPMNDIVESPGLFLSQYRIFGMFAHDRLTAATAYYTSEAAAATSAEKKRLQELAMYWMSTYEVKSSTNLTLAFMPEKSASHVAELLHHMKSMPSFSAFMVRDQWNSDETFAAAEKILYEARQSLDNSLNAIFIECSYDTNIDQESSALVPQAYYRTLAERSEHFATPLHVPRSDKVCRFLEGVKELRAMSLRMPGVQDMKSVPDLTAFATEIKQLKMIMHSIEESAQAFLMAPSFTNLNEIFPLLKGMRGIDQLEQPSGLVHSNVGILVGSQQGELHNSPNGLHILARIALGEITYWKDTLAEVQTHLKAVAPQRAKLLSKQKAIEDNDAVEAALRFIAGSSSQTQTLSTNSQVKSTAPKQHKKTHQKKNKQPSEKSITTDLSTPDRQDDAAQIDGILHDEETLWEEVVPRKRKPRIKAPHEVDTNILAAAFGRTLLPIISIDHVLSTAQKLRTSQDLDAAFRDLQLFCVNQAPVSTKAEIEEQLAVSQILHNHIEKSDNVQYALECLKRLTKHLLIHLGQKIRENISPQEVARIVAAFAAQKAGRANGDSNSESTAPMSREEKYHMTDLRIQKGDEHFRSWLHAHLEASKAAHLASVTDEIQLLEIRNRRRLSDHLERSTEVAIRANDRYLLGWAYQQKQAMERVSANSEQPAQLI